MRCGVAQGPEQGYAECDGHSDEDRLGRGGVVVGNEGSDVRAQLCRCGGERGRAAARRLGGDPGGARARHTDANQRTGQPVGKDGRRDGSENGNAQSRGVVADGLGDAGDLAVRRADRPVDGIGGRGPE